MCGIIYALWLMNNTTCYGQESTYTEKDIQISDGKRILSSI